MNASGKFPHRLAMHIVMVMAVLLSVVAHAGSVLSSDNFKHYIDSFNSSDRELYPQFIKNDDAWSFLSTNIPLFECCDSQLEQTYYFRWWTYRKHIEQTPDGFVITEFLPKVGWSGKYNTIDCAAGHHFYEGRWLRDPRYLNDYALFWFRKGGDPHRYSFWAADAIYARYLVTGDKEGTIALLPDLIQNFETWGKMRRDDNGLFWQNDTEDGMEMSIGGSGYRATINSYMYGDARAIAAIATLAGQKEIAERFTTKAAKIKNLVQEKLWNPKDQFFEVLPRTADAKLVGVRELHGYTPWYFNLPDPAFSVAWEQLTNSKGFSAPFGPTTAEQRDPHFAVSYQGHECQWNGPSWPYSTAITLTALANLLNSDSPCPIDKSDYFGLLRSYSRSQLKGLDGSFYDQNVVPWIDENLNPQTGDWIARTRLKTWRNGTWDPAKGGEERGKDYNHSTFCDLVISGLVGLRPRADDIVEVNPLLPEGTWDFFCLDDVPYHGRRLTILFDHDGLRYKRGPGLHVLADGVEIARADKIQRVTAPLPTTDASQSNASTSAGWIKSPQNPVLGGKLGTCFDISVLKEDRKFRMWFSWRPKASVALVESDDGIHWGEPVIVLGPNPATSWEQDINRPVVIKKDGAYEMWYTGQASGKSWIGYATSPDGVTWRRMSADPVLSPGGGWESAAVMCPDVLWDAAAKRYRMWYSGGEQYEPNAIGYATSPDGLHWQKNADNPIFRPDKQRVWEQDRVTACQVVRDSDWFYMFYIGFSDVQHAQIGVARSRDGLTEWERHPLNPIIRTGENQWDGDAVYKPCAVLDGDRWLLWYNGRVKSTEQIGLATHAGRDLGF